MHVGGYWSLYAVGASLSVVAAGCLGRKHGLSFGQLSRIAILLSSMGIAGAYGLIGFAGLFPVLAEYFPSGSSMLGGILLAWPSVYIVARLYEAPAPLLSDLAATCAPLGFAVGRIGCWLHGCCHGSCLGLPVQLISAAVDLLMFIALVSYFVGRGTNGRLVPLFLIIYGSKRFLLGFYRTDAPLAFASLNAYQIIGLGVAISGMIALSLTITKMRLRLEEL